MTQTIQPAGATGVDDPHKDRQLWRWAGGLGLGHIVLLLAAFSTEGVAAVAHGSAPNKVLSTYGDVSITRVELGSYVEAMAFVLLIPALVVFARLLGRRTDTGHVAAQTALGLGVAYVGATLAIGFPPLTASVYGAHHGVDAGSVSLVNDLRNYGFLLQVGLSVAFALALGIAARAEGLLVKWAGWGGIVVGVVGLVATPFADNATSMVWIVWWVGLCVLSLRGGPRTERA
jgi:hypothetical protein